MVEAADVSTSGILDAHLPIYDFLGLKIEHQSAHLVVARFTVSMSSMQVTEFSHNRFPAAIFHPSLLISLALNEPLFLTPFL